MEFIEILKVIILGIVEGITEWLPISSTGHMLLVDEFLQLNLSAEFKELFFIVIQLGAILAVIVLFWNKMIPIKKDKQGYTLRKDVIDLWFKVVVACIPGAIVTILFDDYVEAHFKTPTVIAIALIVYGIVFLIVENRNKKIKPKITELSQITYYLAFMVGVFQILSIIPGTSRSGSTIIGGLILGMSRVVIAEFTFFIAVPVMFGYSALKLLKFNAILSMAEIGYLGLGMLVAFITSLLAIKFLMNYIKKNDFKVFGYYRIILGILVLLFFFLI